MRKTRPTADADEHAGVRRSFTPGPWMGMAFVATAIWAVIVVHLLIDTELFS